MKGIRPKTDQVLFLDLEGTLVRPRVDRKYPESTDDWEIIPEITKKAFDFQLKYDLLPVIVSDMHDPQLGTMPDTYTNYEEVFYKRVKNILDLLLVNHNLSIEWFYFSKKDNPTTWWLKPNPGMAYFVANRHKIVLRKSYMVGNASGKKGQPGSYDRDFAHMAGIGQYYDIKDFLKLKF